jgi:glycosyltransferase involved in cell wall biosynthesis
MNVSTIIRTFNRAHLLEKAVGIALSQTGVEQEIIVVDGASTDGTEAIASRLPVRYVRHIENYGCIVAANSGVLAATGDYVAFLDTDDEWHSGYLKENLRNADISFCDAELVDLKGRRSESLTALFPAFERLRNKVEISSEEMYLCLLEASPIRPSASIIKRELFARIGLFNAAMQGPEDWEFYLRAARSGASFCYLNKALITQFYYNDSAHIVFEERDRLGVIKVLKDLTFHPVARRRLGQEYANLAGYYRERNRRVASVQTAFAGLRLTYNPRFLLQAAKALIC